MKFSILIPVYNERYTVAELIRRVLAAPLPAGIERELIVVDDGSTDGTREILEALAEAHVEIVYHPQPENRGKGCAIRRAVESATGDFCIFQDADLEYDPRDYEQILGPLLSGDADVVYGSRFTPRERRRVLYFWHEIGNRFLTLVSNLLTDLNLTDMETCYKAFRTDLLKTIPIRSDDFGLEPELTAKVAKRGFRVYEVPINYNGRTYAEGKKITWRDGVRAFWVMLKYRLVDDLYDRRADADVSMSLDRAHRFNHWFAERIRPHLGHRILELGARVGNYTQRFLPRDHYVATEVDESQLRVLRNLALRRPNLEVSRLDLTDRGAFETLAGDFDTVLCVNVLQHLEDVSGALANLSLALRPGGRAIVRVPQGPGRLGSLDRALGYRRRFTEAELRKLLEEAGLVVEAIEDFNRVGVLGWAVNGKILGRTQIPRYQLKFYDSLVWLWRRIDRWLPWSGLALVARARRPDGTYGSPTVDKPWAQS